MSTGLPARNAALAILSGVLQKRRPLDAGLDHLAGLQTRDAGFARALVSESLRHMGALDAVLRKFIAKPLQPHKAGATGEILLLGACELLILKVAPHAAVDAANQLAAKDSKAVHFKPLINAVLRKVAKEGEAVLSGLDRERLSTPDWLWTRWMAQYGAGTARLIARAHQQAAPVDVVLKSPHAAVPESDDLFGNVRRLKAEGRIEDLPGFAEGDWWVQDAAATLPALLLGDVTGKKVIDLCAAPGGKTMQLAARGAKVTAVEIDATRAERIRENLARTKLDAEIVQSDPRQRLTRFWKAAPPWSSPAASWSLPSAHWSARKARSRSRLFWIRIRNFPARPSQQRNCSTTANGSHRTATCAPCPAIWVTKAAWMDSMRRA